MIMKENTWLKVVVWQSLWMDFIRRGMTGVGA
jgi:hypothetical protein